MLHKFGVVIFVPVGVKKLDHFQYEPDDPFCYNCGQKLINVSLDDVLTNSCPGPSKNSTNIKVYE